MQTYHVRAKRWEHGWELRIEGIGVTQSRTLWDAQDMARDLISRREDLPGNAFTVTVTPEIGGCSREEPAPRGRLSARTHQGAGLASGLCVRLTRRGAPLRRLGVPRGRAGRRPRNRRG